MSVAGRRILVVPCDDDGRCAPGALDGRAGIEAIWLSPDATPPNERVVVTAEPTVVSATFAAVVDAVKRVDDDGGVLETVDRSILRRVRPPALVPVEAITGDDGEALLAAAVRRVGAVELSPGAR
ncbi:MAG: hypothetical protein AAGA17_18220 [Actinomycetota bacterium]